MAGWSGREREVFGMSEVDGKSMPQSSEDGGS